jgi:hypothetical protein
MDADDLKTMVQDIVEQATLLKNKHIDDKNAPVNYACIFSQSKGEYIELLDAAGGIGKVVDETPTGPLFQIIALKTVSGALNLLKIRVPDATRPERGDADFTVSDFQGFKERYLPKDGFKLIERGEGVEMIELMDPEFDVRAYFSNPPLDKQLGIR